MSSNDGWATVEVPDNVEYEIEEEVAETPKQEVKQDSEDNNIKELDGIETQGAQKRISKAERAT